MEIKVEKTLANLSSELSAEEALINKTETDVVVMTTSEKHIRKKQNQKNTRNASKEKEDFGGICFYCKNTGHKKINCYKLKNNFKKKGQAHGQKKEEEKCNDEAFIVNARG